MWQPSPSYPDPAVIALSPRFRRHMIMNAAVERLHQGTRWGEGPVWFADHRCLLWSDIPNNRILRWDEHTGTVTPFRQPSNHANGNTRDREGRLVTCEHGARRVTRTERDGRITVLADRFEGRRLNSPNDVVVAADGAVWFTDPPFGILSDYEGERAESEVAPATYRLDPVTGALAMVDDTTAGPNGLAFSPDGRILYLVESRGEPHRRILAFDVDGTRLSGRRVLIDAGPGGTPDGFRCDELGNLWCGWGMGTPELDGVMVFAPDGEPIGRIALPERCANVCFGGPNRSRLFMAAGQGLYALHVNTRGLPYA